MFLEILVFLAINIILIFFSLSVSFYFGTKKELIVVASSFVIYISTIIFILTVLGVSNLLNAVNYTTSIFLLGILTFYFAFRRFKNDLMRFYIRIKSHFFNLSGYKKLFIFGLSAVFIWWSARLVATPVWDYDAIAYHLPFTVKFIQLESIRHIYFSAISGPIGYYPSNIELLYAHFLMFLKFDSVLNAFNLIFYILIFFVLYLISRELNVSRGLSLVAGFAFLTMPVFLRQIGTTKIDIFFTLFFALLSLFIIRYLKNRNFFDFLIASLAAGIFFGTRYLAIPYLFLPLIAVLLFFLIRLKAGGRKKAFFQFLSGVFLFVLVGGYWYIRNFFATGNPIFPANISVFGKTIFEGLGGGFSANFFSSSIISNAGDLNNVLTIGKHYISETGIVLPIIFIFFISLIIFQIKNFAKDGIRTGNSRDKIIAGIFLAAVPIYFYFYAQSPYTFRDFDQNIRYSLPALFLGILMSAFVVNVVFKHKVVDFFAKFVFVLAIVINLSFVILFKEPQMAPGSDISKIYEIRGAFYQTLEDTYGGFTPVLEAAKWVEYNTPENAKIGYSGFQFHYPLFGEKFSHQVDYIAPGKCFECNHYDFKKFDGNIFANSNYTSWLENIRYYNIDYYVFFNQGTFPQDEKKWFEDNPSFFVKVYDDKGALVYKVKVN